jgi:hypothetical protein
MTGLTGRSWLCVSVAARAAALLLATAASGGAAASADELAADDRAFVEKLATARARSRLLALVQDLPLTADLTVGGWVARDLATDRALRLWIRTLPPSSAPRVYGDATCDADVTVPPAALRDKLLALAAQAAGETSQPAGPDFRAAARTWPVLWASATAALNERSTTRKPSGWEDIAIEGVETARRAAATDALHALLDEAGRMKVTAARRLSEFLDSSPQLRQHVLSQLQEVVRTTVEAQLDQVVTAEARVSVGDLVRILTEACRSHYRGELFQPADFREMALRVQRDELTAAGLAIPPEKYHTRTRLEPLDRDAPQWAQQSLTESGRCPPAADASAADETARLEYARIAAIERLRPRVEALIVQQDVNVAQFLGFHPELKDDVVLFLSGARLSGRPRTTGGAIEVDIELPLRRLWQIVRRGMQVVETEPLDTAGPATAPAAPEKP